MLWQRQDKRQNHNSTANYTIISFRLFLSCRRLQSTYRATRIQPVYVEYDDYTVQFGTDNVGTPRICAQLCRRVNTRMRAILLLNTIPVSQIEFMPDFFPPTMQVIILMFLGWRVAWGSSRLACPGLTTRGSHIIPSSTMKTMPTVVSETLVHICVGQYSYIQAANNVLITSDVDRNVDATELLIQVA
jgi:hypothetical protein